MIIYIGGSQLAFPIAESVTIDNRIFERSTASFACLTDEAVRYVKGQVVEIRNDDNTETIFKGYVNKSVEEWIADNENPEIPNLHHEIECVDYHYLADKRIVARAYQNRSAGDIVRDLIDGYITTVPLLQHEGVTIGSISQGPMMTEVVFNYVTVARAITSLAETIGYWWIIREDRKLYFLPREAVPAPYVVTSEDVDFGSVKVENASPLYRNRQYLKGARGITDLQTETQYGDANKRAYTMAFPLNAAPTVQVSVAGGGFVTKTVGIGGVDTGKDWYWNKEETVVFQDPSATPLNAADRVKVQYYGQFDMVVLTYNNAEIALRKAAEGGDTTGFVDDVMEDNNITGRDSAFQRASGVLGTYAVVGRTVTFDTYLSGLKPGQLIEVDFEEHNLIGDNFLIESVAIQDT